MALVRCAELPTRSEFLLFDRCRGCRKHNAELRKRSTNRAITRKSHTLSFQFYDGLELAQLIRTYVAILGSKTGGNYLIMISISEQTQSQSVSFDTCTNVLTLVQMYDK